MQQTNKPSVSSNFDEVYQLALDAATKKSFECAVAYYDAALAIIPSHAEAYYKRGNALKSLGRLDAAIQSYIQSIALNPSFAYAYCNLGAAQQAAGLTTDALLSYDQAIALDPADSISHYNRALLMQDLLRWEDALRSYDRALQLSPEFPDAQYNRALAQLYGGDFENGWSNYEWRWKNVQRLGFDYERDFAEPAWLGNASIEGKRILLHSEGGLGDTIQFCRYAPLVAKMGAEVHLEVPSALVGLMKTLDGVSRIYAKGDPLPTLDFHCPLMSLPLAMKSTLFTIPSSLKYLRADAEEVSRWRSVLGSSERLRVGIAWSGNLQNPIDDRRSILLAELLGHLPKEFEYFCLQNDVRAVDASALWANPQIRKFESNVMNFVGTAALCQCLDLVISVDTSLAHLAGALGCATWILLPKVPDWRWLRDRSDSPWYPTMRLFRQEQAGNWDEMLERVGAELLRFYVD